MNKIYKVIWSKVKHQYVVVSELAHRDGKRSSVAGKSVKTMLAVCALCGAAMLGGYGMPNVYAAGADTLPGQYIAIGEATIGQYTDSDRQWIQTGDRPWEGHYETIYYRDLEDANGTEHRYVYTKGNDGKYYWVREGYSIEIVENKRYPTAEKNTVINTYKGANADSDGLVQSYQNVQENMNIGTLNGDTLFTTNTDMYGGAVNTSTTAITTGQNYRIEQNGRYIEAGLDNLGSYFNTKDVVYHENTGLYTFHGQVVGTENLYVIGGNVGVFTTTANGDTLYTGDVYGRNNEILMTAVDENGNLVSYWGAEIVDPNATIGSMTISTLEGKFDEVNKNIEKIHKDDIKEIQVAPTGTSTDGQGGTIGLQTNGAFDADGNPTGGKAIPGGITVTSIGGTNGNDVQVKFSNTDPDTKQTNSFTVNAGSKVVGKVGEVTATEGQTLDGISINGVDYKLGGGATYTAGNNVHISTDNKISADAATVSADSNFTVTPTTNEQTNVTDYNIKLNNTVTVGSGEGTHPVTINGTEGYVTGLQNTTWNGTTTTPTRAATEAQLQTVSTEAGKHTTVAAGDNISVATDTNDAGGVEYTISATGLADTNLSNITNSGKTVIQTIAKGVEQHITPKEFKAAADGTVTMTYTDGNGNVIQDQTATITGLATDAAVKAAKTEVEAGTNVASVGTREGADGQTIYTVNAEGATVSADSNFTVTPTTNEQTNVTDYNIKLNNTVTVGSGEGTHPVTINGTEGYVTGLQNTTWNGTTTTPTRAATEGQLQTVADTVNAGWTATDDAGNKINVNPKDHPTLNFASGKNVTVSAADGEISVSLNDEVKLGDYDNGTGIYLSGASGTISATNSISVGEDLVIDGNKKTVNGLSNKTWSKDSFVSGQAATEDQLDAMADWTETQVNNSGWTASTNGGKEDEKTEAITNGETVDFSNTDGNIKVSQDVTANGTSIKFNLNDDLLLGANADEGAGINLSGTAGEIAIKSANGSTINIGNGVITGLTNTVSNENWETFMNSDLGNNGSRAVTEDDLQLVAQHSVQYKTNDDGTIDYNNIFLSGASYSSDGHTGGTMITNVAYASDSDGSAAVNVDKLHDAISDAKTEVTNADKHLNYDKTYSVDRETNKVNLEVVDNQGNVVGNTTIEDVASATDVGNIGDLNSDIAHDSTGDGNVSIVDAVNNVDNKVGDLNYKHDDGSDLNYVTAGDSVTGAIGDLDAAIKDAATEAGQHSSVSGSDNITVAENGTNGNGGTDYKVSLNDDLTLGGKEGQNGSIAITGSEGTITASGNVSAGSFTTGSITINGANEDGTHTGTINGLSNKTWDANNIVSGQAATEDQLKAATEGAVQYDRNEDGTVNKGSITLGGSTYNEETHEGGTTITNVADGKNASDAVNMSQLWQTNQAVINNSNNIQSLSNQVGKLDNRIDEVGAGAAALAALHPLDFDPDDKWDFSAGYGNYRGESAVAVGAFYRPNEDTMFSVGGTVGNGDNMVNAGVSFKIGQGNSVSTSRVAMAKEIKSMRDIVAKQDAQIQKLTAMVNALVGIQSEPDTTTMFPDVPENHWAYEAVAAMAKSGLVKGYPDGEFKGDRTMTRYEFAQIVYNAIQAGAEVDARLIEEFKPELEYFHIATVAKDKDGNPTIERVRAN